MDPPVGNVTFLDQRRSVVTLRQLGPCVSNVTFLDQRRSVGAPCPDVTWFLVGFKVFQGGSMVFHGFWLVFHGSRLVTLLTQGPN